MTKAKPKKAPPSAEPITFTCPFCGSEDVHLLRRTRSVTRVQMCIRWAADGTPAEYHDMLSRRSSSDDAATYICASCEEEIIPNEETMQEWVERHQVYNPEGAE